MGLLTLASVLNLIVLTGVAWPADAHQEDQLLANHAGLAGIECTTGSLPRKIAPNHFVLDRITHCVPIVRLAVIEYEPMLENRSVEEEAVEASRVPTADQLPSWSPTRDRLSNRQYARSLRELGRSVRRTSR
jgi:hypothetical protein